MPDDRSSLETLSHAYEHVGDRVKALDYLIKLANVVLAESDAETAPLVLERLQEYTDAGAEVHHAVQQLQELQSATPSTTATLDDMELSSEDLSQESASLRGKPQKDLSEFRVTDELAFAWKLFEAGEISQEDYSVVAQDLAELSIDPHLSTVSVLHVLEHKAFAGIERVMGYASRDTKTPLISLKAYEVPEETFLLLPPSFTIRRGAVVFGRLLDELLVAVMNPYDMGLRKDVEKQTGLTCHFFMTIPGEFDGLISLFSTDA
jgi:hypothetical protein